MSQDLERNATAYGNFFAKSGVIIRKKIFMYRLTQEAAMKIKSTAYATVRVFEHIIGYVSRYALPILVFRSYADRRSKTKTPFGEIINRLAPAPLAAINERERVLVNNSMKMDRAFVIVILRNEDITQTVAAHAIIEPLREPLNNKRVILAPKRERKRDKKI